MKKYMCPDCRSSPENPSLIVINVSQSLVADSSFVPRIGANVCVCAVATCCETVHMLKRIYET